MARAVERPPHTVELVGEPLDMARTALTVVLFLVRVVANARREGDAIAVGRPGDFLGTLLQVGELERLAALDGDDVDLSGLLGVAVRDEGEPGAVRGPARRGVAPVAVGEASRGGRAVGRHEPDGR